MYKIGDKVLYKESLTLRRIRDINESGQLLLWGLYEYTNPQNVRKLYCTSGSDFCNNKEISEDEFEISKYIFDENGAVDEEFKKEFLGGILCEECYKNEYEEWRDSICKCEGKVFL